MNRSNRWQSHGSCSPDQGLPLITGIALAGFLLCPPDDFGFQFVCKLLKPAGAWIVLDCGCEPPGAGGLVPQSA